VVNVIKWQDLSDVVLVGHSYGGMVISGVAERMEKSIASIVMLDAFFPADGQRAIDLFAVGVRDAILKRARDGATATPPPPAATANVNKADQAWVDARCTPHPIKCFLQAAIVTGARDRIAKRNLHPRGRFSQRCARRRHVGSARQGLAHRRDRRRTSRDDRRAGAIGQRAEQLI